MPRQNLVNHERRMGQILDHNRKDKNTYNSKHFHQQMLFGDLNEKEKFKLIFNWEDY